jgi:hypothetical protein
MSNHLQSLLIDGKKPCKQFFSTEQCSFGDQCSFSHDVHKWNELRAEQSSAASSIRECPFFEQAGKCPFGFLCVYSASHIKDGKLVTREDSSSVIMNQDSTSFDAALRAKLRSKKYEYSISSDMYGL